MLIMNVVSSSQEFDIEPECDSDQVDDLLALCLKQALAHARSNSDGVEKSNH